MAKRWGQTTIDALRLLFSDFDDIDVENGFHQLFLELVDWRFSWFAFDILNDLLSVFGVSKIGDVPADLLAANHNLERRLAFKVGDLSGLLEQIEHGITRRLFLA